jgi:hypothetical protein
MKGDAFPALRTARRLSRTRNESPFLSSQNKPFTALLRMCNASPFRSIIHYDFPNVSRYREINALKFHRLLLSIVITHCIPSDGQRRTHPQQTRVEPNERKRPRTQIAQTRAHSESARACSDLSAMQICFASKRHKGSKHLVEKHAVPAPYRKELVSYIDSLDLPNPNLLSGRRNGSEPHPHLLVSRGAACKYCTFHSKSSLPCAMESYLESLFYQSQNADPGSGPHRLSEAL